MNLIRKIPAFNFRDDVKELISLMNTLPYGILLIRPDREIFFANKVACELTGNKKLSGTQVNEIFSTDTDNFFKKAGQVVFSRNSLRHKNGKEIPVLKTVQQVVINQNKYTLEVITDITNQQKIEIELREKTSDLEKILREKQTAEETAKYEAIKFETLFEEVGDALFVHDMAGNLLKVNQKACERLGYTREQYSKMNMADIEVPKNGQQVGERMAFLKTDKKIRYKGTHVTLKGHRIPVEVFSKLIDFDGKEAILTSVRNITKQIERERELIEARTTAEQNEAKINQILNNIPSTVFTYDKSGRILQFNEEGIAALNINKDNFVGKQIGNLFECANTQGSKNACGTTSECSNCNLLQSINQTIHEHRTVLKKEISLLVDTNNSTEKKTFLLSTAILDQQGDNVFLGYLDDITEIKKTEVELNIAREKAQESDRLKSQFLNNISHEIRTPLNGIVGFLDLFEQNHLSDEDRKKFIGIMRKSSDRLIETVNTIIDISKFESSAPRLKEEKFLLSDALERVGLESNAKYESTNIDFSWTLDEALKNQFIEADWQKLVLILNHLISNAFKFTSNGYVHLSAKHNGTDIELTVEDTGKGIHENELQEVFKPFWKSEDSVNQAIEGNGLGLTMAKKLAHLMGGDITVSSQIGKGSIFRFTLPNVLNQSLHTKNEKLGIEELQDKTILIAEDDVNNFMYLEAVLLSKGCNVIHAQNGVQAVEYVQQQKNIDLVLMDLRMPLMDGFTATREIRKTNKHLPVIAHSAFVLNNEKAKALEAECNDYLPKPVKRDELITAILTHLTVNKDNRVKSA